MSTEPLDGHRDSRVVPLRAVEAQTEVRLDEDQAPGPSYVDLTGGEAKRRPVIPDHWRAGRTPGGTSSLMAARHGHRAAYHGVRSPAYFTKSLGFAIWGVVTVVRRLVAWWHIPGTTRLEWDAAANGQLNEHLRLHKQGRETRKARGIILALCLAGLVVAVVAMVVYAPWWAWALAAARCVRDVRAGRAPAGQDDHHPGGAARRGGPAHPRRDCAGAGVAGYRRDQPGAPQRGADQFPVPVREDGPGWRFEVDLPYGVTATQVIERREQFASGLRRPLGAVWPEVVSHEHAGRLEGWVGRVDISRARPAPWPWLRTGGGNVFGPLPFGVSPRQRRVDVSVIEHNWLIGSMPGQGKTSAVRVLVAAASLDPTVEMWIHELKGTGDLDWFEPCCHRFISGIDDESIGYAAESLKLLRAEVMKRSARLKKVQAEHRELCPDKKITREIANRRSLRLHPLLAAFDELQNLFAHPKYGKQAGEDATFIIKIGRALGVFLVLATQRPDKESLPTGISGNVSTRFCLKVAGQVENDMILGTSAYKNGARATTFRPKVDAGLGYLKGEENVPQVVRTYYLNDADTERVARRARALREAAGTLSGVALGEDDRREERDVRADLAAVAGTENGLHWAEAAGRLAERFPERWAGATADSVSAEARGQGIASVDVRRSAGVAKGVRRQDVAS